MAAERPPPRVTVPLGQRPRTLPSPPRSPYRWEDPWLEIEEGNLPTPPRDSLGPISRPDPFARLIEGTRTPLNIIPDRNFLVLNLTTAPAEGETAPEAEAEEQDNEAEPREEVGPVIQIPHETESKAAEYHARYLRTPGVREDPDGTEPHTTSHTTTCTICPTAALTHQAYPSVEPSTNRYKKLQKVYSDFIVLTCEGINGKQYTLTFVDAYSRHVWIATVDFRSKAPQIFRIWLAHAQRQSGKKLKIWQTDGAKEFCSNELERVVAEKGIKHQISLPYSH
ncbi:unnamed protein product [Closterium sp. NIES-53]